MSICIPTEIERKFLVVNEKWKDYCLKRSVYWPVCIEQGYITTKNESIVRVRIVDNSTAFLTLKDNGNVSYRHEFEYPIPVKDAKVMFKQLCDHFIYKCRLTIPYEKDPTLKWEVDVYQKQNKGLVTAEIELPFLDKEIELPDWIGEEVTYDDRYKNNNLALFPYSTWKIK